MSVDSHYCGGRSRTLTFATALVMLGACEDPEQRSDLRPAGDPEVLAVLVMNDAADLYVEAATFCKVGDDKRPTEVFLITGAVTEVCPLDATEGVPMVMDAVPTGWYVRVVFDELLDPDIEELIPNLDGMMQPTGTSRGSIANTRPVTLTCDGNPVAYDGYYSPSGNYQTWPVGPSLVIIPDDPTSVAAGSECTVTINTNVVDKDQNRVPDAQRGMGGEYKFQIAPLSLDSTDPEAIPMDGAADRPETDPAAPVTLHFNTVIDPASITTSEVLIFRGVAADCTGGMQVPAAQVTLFQMLDEPGGSVADPMSLMIADGGATMANPDPSDPESMGNMFSPATAYRIEFTVNADVQDAAGATAALELPDDILCFITE